MLISVILPTYNRAETLKYVLPAFKKQSCQDFELILADSNSSDGTAELVHNLGMDQLNYIRGGFQGRGEARNAGIAAARGELILFNDADIIPHENLLAEHLAMHAKFKPCAVVGQEIRVQSFEEYLKTHSGAVKLWTLHPESRKTLSWLYFLTGNASLPKKILEAAGGFDPNFTGYGHEDLELGYRLQKKGLTIYYQHKAISYHLHPSVLEEQLERFHLAGISTVRFYNKHRDWSIKAKLGMTPLAFAWHKLLAPEGTLLRYCAKHAGDVKWCRELLLQYRYIDGMKAGLEKFKELRLAQQTPDKYKEFKL